MENQSNCCTCATAVSENHDFNSESKSIPSRNLACCNRVICGDCQRKNSRFQSYCPYCQISNEPSSLPQGLRDPPAYDEAVGHSSDKAHPQPSSEPKQNIDPPAYSEAAGGGPTRSRNHSSRSPPDVEHHIRQSDTMQSLSLAYRVPAQVLRAHNSVFTDGLLAARRTIMIPGSHYSGPSLSAEPLESEEEREWRSKLRRFMVSSKCSDYSVAELYVKQADGDVEAACSAWAADERWEQQNPYNKDKHATSKLTRSKQAMAQRR